MAGQTEIGELQVLITAQADKFNSEIAKVQRQIGALGDSVGKSTRGIGAMAVAGGAILANAFSKAFSAIASQADAAVTRLDTLNNFPQVMSNLGIGADESQQAINKLSDVLTGLPTSLSDAALAVQRFTSANGNIMASTDMYLALNDAILAGGASTEIQATAMEQLAQAYAKGKPDMQEWRSMLIAMPAQLNQVASAMGYVSSNDLGEALREGTVSMNDFMRTVMRLDSEGVNGFASFAEQARNATGGVQTSIANLRIAIQRGIANIMGAIGQANIAGFFNKIASVIGTVSNYIAAFVRIVKEAIAWVSALFGGSGSTDTLVKETGTTSSNLASGADSAGDMADNLGDAGKAAKKLKGQLASFDEMNVLAEKDTSSGGSGGGSGSGGGGGAGGGFSDFQWGNDYTSDAEDKIKALADKMKQWFQDAFNFDWETIGAAFVRFWDDIKAAAEPVGAIIKDIWNDYIRPLVTWAGNSLLPAVLNAIGGAIRLVGAVIKEFWDAWLKPFIDAFLVPIAKWTGGVIVDVLNKIGDSLRKFSQSEQNVKLLTSALVALGGAISAIKIGGLVNQFSKAVPVFTKVWKSGATLGTALGAVAQESSGLIGSISGLVGSGLNKLSTSFLAAKTALAPLLSGFMALPAPIQAVAAIVGVLFATNEEFRNGIISLLQAALKPLLSVLGTVTSLIQPIISICTSLINTVLKVLLSILNPIGTILGAIFEAISPIVSIIGSVATALNPVVALLKVLQPILDAVSAILGEISKAADIFCGWLTDVGNAIGEAIGGFTNLGASEEDVKKMNENLTDSAKKYTDELERQQGIIASQADTLKGLDEAERQLTEANNALLQAEQASGSQLHLNAEEVQNLVSQLVQKGSTEERLQAVAETYGLSLDTQRDQVTNLYNAIVDENSAYNDLNTKQEQQKSQLEELAASEQTQKDALNEQIAAIKDAGLNSDQLNQKLAELTADGSANSLALKDEIIKNAGEFGMKWDDTTQSMQSDSSDLWSNVESTWNDVGNRFGSWFEEAKNNVGSKFNEIGNKASEKWNEIQNTFAGVGNWFGDRFNEAKNGMSQAFSGVGNWANDRFNDIKNAFSGAYQNFTNIGNNIWNGIRDGIGNVVAKGQEIFSGMVNGIKNFLGIHSPSKLFAELGGYVGEGFAEGISDETSTVQHALEGLTTNFRPMEDLEFAISSRLSESVQDDLQNFKEEKQPIQIMLKIDGRDIPVDAERVADALNNASFLNNRSVVNI